MKGPCFISAAFKKWSSMSKLQLVPLKPKLWIFIEKYNCYLVYMPAKRELESGLLDQPAMCTTVHSLHTGKLPSVYVMFGKISEISL